MESGSTLSEELSSIARTYYGVSLTDPEYPSKEDLFFFLQVVTNYTFARAALVASLGDAGKAWQALLDAEKSFKDNPDVLRGWLTGEGNVYKQAETEAYKKGYEEGYSKGFNEGEKQAKENG